MGPPHTPELNGKAERYNRTLLNCLKPSLSHSSLHREYWSHALDYAVWTTNRSPTQTNEGFKTPYDIYEGRLSSMRHAHIFGAEGVYLVPAADRKKMDDHPLPFHFMGVLPHGDGVKVLDKSTNCIIKTGDAIFDEKCQSAEMTHKKQSINPPTSKDSAWIYPTPNHEAINNNIEGNQIHHNPLEEAANHCLQRLRQHPARYGNLKAYSAAVENSPTYKMAVNSSNKELWLASMKVEIDNFVECNVFTLVPRPSNRKIISCRWHLKKKFNLYGTLKKFKARLVARGFTQREGFDYQETFAPSSRQESLEAFLAVSGHRYWDSVQLDVVGAFLYGDLDEEIYLSQPEGFINEHHPNYVWESNSSLYGLKKSARQWHQCLSDQLKKIGFETAQVDPSLHLLRQDDEIIASILVHVEDILLAGTHESNRIVERMLHEKLKLIRSKDVSHFLSFDITRNRTEKSFTMNQ